MTPNKPPEQPVLESNFQRKKREAAEHNATYEARELYKAQRLIAIEMSAGLPEPQRPARTKHERQSARDRNTAIAMLMAYGSLPYMINRS